LRYDRSFLRWVCMRIDPLCMLDRASRNAQLPLPRLPAFQWRSFRLRLYCPGIGGEDYRYAKDAFSSCWQRQSCDSQLLFRLWRSSIHLWRSCSRIYVHPLFHAGQAVGVSADVGHLDVQCATVGLPQSGNSSLSSVASIRLTTVRTIKGLSGPQHANRRQMSLREHRLYA